MKRFLFLVLVVFSLVINVYAQNIPQLVNYQGKLTDSTGNPLATAEYEMSFSIYTEKTGGTLVWGPQEFKDTNKVTVAKGFFNVILGPVDSIDRKIEEAFNSPNAYLEISVNGSIILPRQQVLSTSYAFQAQKAVKADEAKIAVDGVTPVGSVITWPTENIPEGYIACNGQSLLTSEYPELFTVLGYRYGGSDGNFNLPDYRGQFLRGVSDVSDNDPNKNARSDRGDGITGNVVGTKQEYQVQIHSHLQTIVVNKTGFKSPHVNAGFLSTSNQLDSTNQTKNYGGNETRPKNIYVIFCIKYKKYNQ